MSASSKPRSRTRRLFVGLIAAGAVGAIWFFAARDHAATIDEGRAPWEGTEGPRPIPVRTVSAVRRDLPVHLKAIGTVMPLNTVTVRSRVDGQLLRVVFDEGEVVKSGQLLAEVDPATYEIKLAQALGHQKQDLAQLENARRDLERFQELHEKGLSTAQQLDLQQSLVAEREGTLAADQAAVADAQLQLSYTKILAPISGRAGFRKVDAGNLIRANDQNGLVMITQTQPISVQFTVPEVDLHRVIDPLRAGESLSVEAWDRSEQHRFATGALKTVDNQIDIATGTIRLKAVFDNDAEELFPNQFVNVRLRVRTLENAIVIPSAAIQYGSRGTYVYVVNDKNLAQVRDVELGPVDGAMQSITQGLEAGEAVVLEGLDRLRDGRQVIVTDAGPPAVDS